MIFAHFLLNINETNAYVVACEKTREALLIDPGEVNPSIDTFIEENNLRLTAIFITHAHYDHVDGLKHYVKKFRCPVIAAGRAVAKYKAKKIKEGGRVNVGELEGVVLDTSGHTPDAISLHFPGMVFTGDALFAGSIGGTFSQENKQIETRNIEKKIFSLPEETEIHPGHGPSSTVKIERTYNPFF